MSTLKEQIDRFAEAHSEEELWRAIGELAKKVLKSFDASRVIEVRDAEHQTVGYFMPGGAVNKPDLGDSRLLSPCPVIEWRTRRTVTCPPRSSFG